MPRPAKTATANGTRAKTIRSAITNGRQLFHEKVGDNKHSRRFRDLIHDYASTIGGYDSLDEPRKQLVRRLASISIALEELEFRLAKGERINHEEYAKSAGHQRRIMSDLGILPRPEPDDEDEQPSTPVPVPAPVDPSDLSSLSDDELLALENAHRKTRGLMPLASPYEGLPPIREHVPVVHKPLDMTFIRAFPSPAPDPEAQDEEPPSSEPSQALVDAVREILG